MKKHMWFIFALIMLLGFSVLAQSTDAVVDAVETPPDWLVNALQFMYDVPMVGPWIAKIAQWFAVIMTMVTALTACMVACVNALKVISNWAGLISMAEKLDAFKSGKIMYYLKYVSALFNAKKAAPKA